MLRTDFHFELPEELIAQQPAARRSDSRLLVLAAGALRDLEFRDLPSLLGPLDLLVFNDTRVVPARLHGVKESGGRIEILLERALTANCALVQARASKPLRPQARILLPAGQSARMLGREGDLFHLEFSCDVLRLFEAQGEIPLPPYIARAPQSADRERYQTVFARTPGAVAAPTAGLHFDAGIFAALQARGVRHAFVTLHVGAGTFAPVRVDDIEGHQMHAEYLEVGEAACDAINATRAAGGRVIAVGTTVVRSLETAAGGAGDAGAVRAATGAVGAGDAGAVRAATGTGGAGDAGVERAAGAAGESADERAAPRRLLPYSGATRMFITPGYRFRVVDAMVTNFHLPESTLLMLCAAFAGRETLLAAYAHAVAQRYRFFSYGDAMFIAQGAAVGFAADAATAAGLAAGTAVAVGAAPGAAEPAAGSADSIAAAPVERR